MIHILIIKTWIKVMTIDTILLGKKAKTVSLQEKYMTGRHLFDPKMGLQLEAPGDKGLSGSNTSRWISYSDLV